MDDEEPPLNSAEKILSTSTRWKSFRCNWDPATRDERSTIASTMTKPLTVDDDDQRNDLSSLAMVVTRPLDVVTDLLDDNSFDFFDWKSVFTGKNPKR